MLQMPGNDGAFVLLDALYDFKRFIQFGHQRIDIFNSILAYQHSTKILDAVTVAVQLSVNALLLVDVFFT